MSKLSSLSPARGANRRRKRRGIGPSSGHGGTCGRGHKGQKARSGGKVRADFEGGQMPLIRRVPKRGFRNVFRVPSQVVNVSDLNRFEAGSSVDFDVLVGAGLVRKNGGPVKLLAKGEVNRSLNIKIDAASESAREKVRVAGGTVEVSEESR